MSSHIVRPVNRERVTREVAIVGNARNDAGGALKEHDTPQQTTTGISQTAEVHYVPFEHQLQTNLAPLI